VPNRTLPKALSLSRTKRLQLKLSQQRQQYPLLSNTIFDDNDDDDDSEELDYHRAYGRPKVYKVEEKVIDFDDDKPLSDYVTVRLAVARAKAMLKYRETSAQA
jgi:hypothetical protein